eukprot:10697439-Karenia_brevis.AAC.1
MWNRLANTKACGTPISRLLDQPQASALSPKATGQRASYTAWLAGSWISKKACRICETLRKR